MAQWKALCDSRNKVRSSDEEIQRMADDRAKLAGELDNTEARAKRLSDTNSEVSPTLGQRHGDCPWCGRIKPNNKADNKQPQERN